MKPASLITIVVAVAAVVVAAVVARGGGGGSSPDNPAAASAPKGALALDMRVSPEKEALRRPLVRRFNASNTRAAGTRVFVAMKADNSGDTEAALLVDEARRALPQGGLVRLGLALHRAQRALGLAGRAGRRGRVPALPRPRGHAGEGGRRRLPLRRRRRRARPGW